MADFKIAFGITNKNEGGYVNDPADHGGETYCGISRVNFPHWSGWGIIDNCKTMNHFPEILKASDLLPKLIEDFYKTNFWNPINGDNIPNQDLANQVYDASVNMGVHQALKLLV